MLGDGLVSTTTDHTVMVCVWRERERREGESAKIINDIGLFHLIRIYPPGPVLESRGFFIASSGIFL